MLTLHSFLRQTDELAKSRIVLHTCRGVATGLMVFGVFVVQPGFNGDTGEQVVAASVVAAETDEEESDTKAKIQDGFEDLTISVETFRNYIVSENLSVDPEPLVATKEVISTQVQEKATETVKAENPLSQEDYNVLLKIVEAEAGGEDMKGKILVANVVLNRVESGKFPNNVSSVVYQKSQFSPVSDGRINTVTVSEDTEEAVSRALAGEDYAQGALYFSARDKADKNSMKWFDAALKWLFKHGNHEFYTFR